MLKSFQAFLFFYIAVIYRGKIIPMNNLLEKYIYLLKVNDEIKFIGYTIIQ